MNLSTALDAESKYEMPWTVAFSAYSFGIPKRDFFFNFISEKVLVGCMAAKAELKFGYLLPISYVSTWLYTVKLA